MLGFETIGNATLIAHDHKPVLATDPWIASEPYFGSWDMPYEIPSDQMDAILGSEYIFFSHGHPDHLNAPSLEKVTDKKILVPDHVGGRIASNLRELGCNVQVLATKQWVELSPRIKVMALPDINQDATLLVAIGDHLVINFNDSKAFGYTNFIRKIAARFNSRYLLALRCYGDPETYLLDEQGNRLTPAAAMKPSVGKMYVSLAKQYHGTHLIPFSIFHRYQREDSLWASAYHTPLEAHRNGYDYLGADLLPAFVRVDLERGGVTELRPAQRPLVVKSPKEYGDDWSETLDHDEFARCKTYFRQKEHVAKTMGFITLRVGGQDNRIALNPDLRCGLTLEAPRHSLMAAIDWEIFDDLIIANFMKVTLHDVKSLYPDFTPYVAKYADNGRAQSEDELRSYFKAYRQRSSAEFMLRMVRQQSEDAFRRHFSDQSRIFQVSKGIYHRLVG